MVPFVNMLEGITEIENETKWPVFFYFYHVYTSICIFFHQLLNPKYRINKIQVIVLTFTSNYKKIYINIKQKISSQVDCL